MTKFKVLGDPNNSPNGSSNIIISSLNEAAHNLGLYSSEDKVVVYDCLGFSHGYKRDASICVYEMFYPDLILDNLGGLPTIGVSKDNLNFALGGGYAPELCNYAPLGVDSKKWAKIERTKYLDKFVVLCFSESQTRGGFLETIQAFGKAFSGNKDALLYLKDRCPSDTWKETVADLAKFYNVEIFHDYRDLSSIEDMIDIYSNADIHLYLNHSSTWSMTSTESLSCGLPLFAMPYSGPAEYLSDFNGCKIKYSLEEVTDNKLLRLQELGLRNYLLPRSYYGSKVPCWAEPDIDDTVDKLQSIYNNKDLLKSMSRNARITAEQFTWEKSAMNISLILDKYN